AMLTSWPGCTRTFRSMGLNCQGTSPREFASNSTVTQREGSTCVLATVAFCSNKLKLRPYPVAWQILLYSGTSAYPKPNIASTTTDSLTSIDRLRLCVEAFIEIDSGAARSR